MTRKKKGIPQDDAPPGPGVGVSRSRTVLHLVCEGHTERDYFQLLNKRYGEEYGFSIHLAPRRQRPDKSFQPLAAVEEAARRAKGLSGAQRKNVWAVFDRGEHTDIYQACRLAREKGIKIAFSHPHFELWLWLHFAAGCPAG
jgi:hypothetical protein